MERSLASERSICYPRQALELVSISYNEFDKSGY